MFYSMYNDSYVQNLGKNTLGILIEVVCQEHARITGDDTRNAAFKMSNYPFVIDESEIDTSVATLFEEFNSDSD